MKTLLMMIILTTTITNAFADPDVTKWCVKHPNRCYERIPPGLDKRTVEGTVSSYIIDRDDGEAEEEHFLLQEGINTPIEIVAPEPLVNALRRHATSGRKARIDGLSLEEGVILADSVSDISILADLGPPVPGMITPTWPTSGVIKRVMIIISSAPNTSTSFTMTQAIIQDEFEKEFFSKISNGRIQLQTQFAMVNVSFDVPLSPAPSMALLIPQVDPFIDFTGVTILTGLSGFPDWGGIAGISTLGGTIRFQTQEGEIVAGANQTKVSALPGTGAHEVGHSFGYNHGYLCANNVWNPLGGVRWSGDTCATYQNRLSVMGTSGQRGEMAPFPRRVLGMIDDGSLGVDLNPSNKDYTLNAGGADSGLRSVCIRMNLTNYGCINLRSQSSSPNFDGFNWSGKMVDNSPLQYTTNAHGTSTPGEFINRIPGRSRTGLVVGDIVDFPAGDRMTVMGLGTEAASIRVVRGGPPDLTQPTLSVTSPTPGSVIGNSVIVNATGIDSGPWSGLIVRAQVPNQPGGYLTRAKIEGPPPWTATIDSSTWSPGDIQWWISAYDAAGNGRDYQMTTSKTGVTTTTLPNPGKPTSCMQPQSQTVLVSTGWWEPPFAEFLFKCSTPGSLPIVKIEAWFGDGAYAYRIINSPTDLDRPMVKGYVEPGTYQVTGVASSKDSSGSYIPGDEVHVLVTVIPGQSTTTTTIQGTTTSTVSTTSSTSTTRPSTTTSVSTTIVTSTTPTSSTATSSTLSTSTTLIVCSTIGSQCGQAKQCRKGISCRTARCGRKPDLFGDNRKRCWIP